MKFLSLPLIVAALGQIAAASEIVYGYMSGVALNNRATVQAVKDVKLTYAHIQRDIFSQNKRQVCGSGSTCTSACSDCGTPWCGTYSTSGNCLCEDDQGNCSSGSGSNSEDTSGNSSGDTYCGSGTSCTSACASCGGIWCGTSTSTDCDCALSLSSCTGGGSNGGGGGSGGGFVGGSGRVEVAVGAAAVGAMAVILGL